ncbi:hypothetical protein FRC02_005391 [Tulasnella sp. 418]|nr:hypothetical protein FRC02_005391 [Tulasnella sp. 418]
MISFRAATSPTSATSIPPGDHEASTATSQHATHPTLLPIDIESAERNKHSDGEVDTENSDQLDAPIPAVETSPGVGNLTLNDAESWIWQHTPNSFQRMMYTNYSNGIERDEEQLKKNNLDHRKWVNPLEIQWVIALSAVPSLVAHQTLTRLPNAPSMKIYCLYGHGKETERSYWYARGEYEHDDSSSDAMSAVCQNSTSCDGKGMSPRAPLDMPLSRQSWIDTAVNDASENPVRNGVKIGEGDGTVPLISLGAMCVEGWKRKLYNPAGIEVKTYEMAHQPEGLDMRGGATTSDHIDILGSTALNEIVLKVAAGRGAEVQERFVSDIHKYAKKIKWDG